MSDESCVVYYGLRFEIAPTDIGALESRSDLRMVAARKAGLKSYWGNFGVPGERYLLLVGAQIGVMGPENQMEVQLSADDLDALAATVRAKLAAAGLDGMPGLHVQWQPDV